MADLGNNIQAAVAFNRFGFGGRPDDPVPANAATWLLNQLNGQDSVGRGGLPTLADNLATITHWRAQPSGSAASQRDVTTMTTTFANEINAFLKQGVITTVPFRERLVWFWANHFAILTGSYPTQALAGTFIRDAIRPHVTGTFSDMLLAVMQHPAMIYSLNNDRSTGPNSSTSVQHAKNGGPPLNINENLARETLELYTVGVAEGYTQDDVDAMAMILTGWTVNIDTKPYGFLFNADWHEPTAQKLLGTTFPGTFAGGVSALNFLATHPSTYNHLATQLVQHFVSDAPSAGDIRTVQNALSSSGGNLSSAATALVGLRDALTPLTKFRPPVDYVIAAARAAGVGGGNTAWLANVVSLLGQPVWGAPFPNGYSDLGPDWTGPAPMSLRVDWVADFANGYPHLDVDTVAANSLGPTLSAASEASINQGASSTDRLTLLFCSPEFQRR